MQLNLGCGDDVRPGWLNVDIDPPPGADIRYDLENTPLPWDDGVASRILMDNVLEHIDPSRRVELLSECHRVLAEDGIMKVVTPTPAVGGGWDVSHYSMPSWEWPNHPRWDSVFETVSINASRVGPGRVMPERLALAATSFGIARCVDSVAVEVSPL